MEYLKPGPEGIHGFHCGPIRLYWGTSYAVYVQLFGYGLDFDLWPEESGDYVFQASFYGRPK